MSWDRPLGLYSFIWVLIFSHVPVSCNKSAGFLSDFFRWQTQQARDPEIITYLRWEFCFCTETIYADNSYLLDFQPNFYKLEFGKELRNWWCIFQNCLVFTELTKKDAPFMLSLTLFSFRCLRWCFYHKIYLLVLHYSWWVSPKHYKVVQHSQIIVLAENGSGHNKKSYFIFWYLTTNVF